MGPDSNLALYYIGLFGIRLNYGNNPPEFR
jgi:hypothetical protein